VAVYQENLPAGGGVLDNQSLMELEAVEEWFSLAGAVVNVVEQGFLHDFWVGAFQIMVSIDHMEPSGPVELAHAPENMALGRADVGEVFVLVQLIAIPDLKIGEAFIKVVFESEEEHVLVFGKTICPPVVAPVAIAEKDEAGCVIEGNFLGRLEYFGQSGGYRHISSFIPYSMKKIGAAGSGRGILLFILIPIGIS